MGAMAVPLPDEHVGAWMEFANQLGGPRAAEFAEFNTRMGLDTHQAYLQQSPQGYLVVVIHKGPGGDDFLKRLADSDHPFDRWFLEQISTLHNQDFSQPLPPAPRLLIDFTP